MAFGRTSVLVKNFRANESRAELAPTMPSAAENLAKQKFLVETRATSDVNASARRSPGSAVSTTLPS